MKFYPSDIKVILQKIESGEIKSLLIYGPNIGYQSILLEQLTKKLNLLQTAFSIKDLSASKLAMLANSQNFFMQRELIKITETQSALNKDMKTMLESGDFSALICFVSEESLPPSGIRKFFEDSKNAASIACYYDTPANIARFILQKITKENKTIEDDALLYLKAQLKGDHNIIKNEIDKLINYTHDKRVITLEDTKAAISLDIIANGDEMCIYFSNRNPDMFLAEIEKILTQNINEVLIIRALIRYYINLYIVRNKVENGENIDQAIKSLSPPVFFKYVADFKKTASSISLAEIIKCLSILNQAEKTFKTSPKKFDFLQEIYLKMFGK